MFQQEIFEVRGNPFQAIAIFRHCTQFFRGYYSRQWRGGFVNVVSFGFKATENLQRCGDVFFDILISSNVGGSVAEWFRALVLPGSRPPPCH